MRLPSLIRTIVVLLAFVGSAARQAQADESAATLLAKHKAYVGWEMDDGAIKNLVLDGTISKLNDDGTVTAISKVHEIDLRVLYRSTSVEIKTNEGTEEGLDLNRFWYLVEGFTIPNLGDNRGVILARRIVFSEAIGTLNALPHGVATIDGVSYDILRGGVSGWKPIDLYIDPASGAIKQFVYDPDGTAPEVTMIDAYTTVLSDKRVVSAWHVPGSKYERRYTRVVPNASVTDHDLKPPAPSTTWTFGGSHPTPISAEVDKTMIHATINGVTGNFMLDTGAGIALTDAFTDKAHVKRGTPTTFEGTTGSKNGTYTHADLSFGDGSVLHNAWVLTGIVLPRDEDGLLGFGFLAGAIVDIDLDQQKMTIYDPATSQPDEHNALIMTVDLSTSAPHTPVKIGGTIPSIAMLDTGASGTEFVTDISLFDKVTMDRGRSDVFTFVGASGREQDARCGTIDVIDIGPVPYKDPSICFSKWVGPGATVMGYGFLQHFNATFDYPDAKIVLHLRPR